MNAQESQLDYCIGQAVPEPGRVIEVAPGILWARMRLPFALNHINVWLLEDMLDDDSGEPARAGWTIVDCGIGNDETRASWEEIFAGSLGGLPVLRVIVTHMHPDHLGSAAWLCERWNARLWISATDFNVAQVASNMSAGFGGPLSAEFMARHGLAADPGAVSQVGERINYYKSLVPALPKSYRRLQDGGSIDIGGERWDTIAGYGHAPEHMALHSAARGVLISGDMVLPRISTNVSVTDIEPESNPLTLYLDSIEKLRSIPAGTLVLPSHGLPFKGLHTRIDQLQQHHADRFAEVIAACATGPQTAYDLVPVLFKRPLDLHQMTFAMGESVAHLHALWLQGKLRRRIAADGAIAFSLAA